MMGGLQQIEGSTNVKAVGYDPATKVMTVEFHSGKTYNLTGVSTADHESFMAAESKGGHFHRHLRGKFGPQ